MNKNSISLILFFSLLFKYSIYSLECPQLNVGTQPDKDSVSDIIHDGKTSKFWAMGSSTPIITVQSKAIQYFYLPGTKFSFTKDLISLKYDNDLFASTTYDIKQEGQGYVIELSYGCNDIGGALITYTLTITVPGCGTGAFSWKKVCGYPLSPKDGLMVEMLYINQSKVVVRDGVRVNNTIWDKEINNFALSLGSLDKVTFRVSMSRPEKPKIIPIIPVTPEIKQDTLTNSTINNTNGINTTDTTNASNTTNLTNGTSVLNNTNTPNTTEAGTNNTNVTKDINGTNISNSTNSTNNANTTNSTNNSNATLNNTDSTKQTNSTQPITQIDVYDLFPTTRITTPEVDSDEDLVVVSIDGSGKDGGTVSNETSLDINLIFECKATGVSTIELIIPLDYFRDVVLFFLKTCEMPPSTASTLMNSWIFWGFVICILIVIYKTYRNMTVEGKQGFRAIPICEIILDIFDRLFSKGKWEILNDNDIPKQGHNQSFGKNNSGKLDTSDFNKEDDDDDIEFKISSISEVKPGKPTRTTYGSLS